MSKATVPVRPLFVVSVGAAALSGILFGFDTAVVAGVTTDLTRVFALTPAWLGITISVALWGTLLGAGVAGPLGDRFGGRAMLRLTAALYLVSAIGSAVAPSLAVLMAARFIGGLAIGASSVLAPVYIAELAPPALRGRLVGLFQLSIVGGILLAYLSNGIVASVVDTAIAWRWKLGVAIVPALILVVLMTFVPASPRWLRSRGRPGDAVHAAERLGIPLPPLEPQGDVARLQWRQHRRPILLAVLLAAFNQLAGINAILYYLNDIFAAAGFSTLSADRQAVVVGIVNLLATMLGMALIDRAGRKRLLQVGAVGTATALLVVGFVQAGTAPPALLLPALILFIAAFALSQGAVIWVYLSEIFPQAVRARGAGLGSMVHWLLNALIAAAFPLVAAMSPSLPFFVFAAMMAAQLVIVSLFFPETKGISLERTAEL